MVWYISIFSYIWQLFKIWINTLFVVPFQTTDMLWLLVPIWLSWFFSEFYQEKIGTSMGNAITNAVVVLWASIDCMRKTLDFVKARIIVNFWDMFPRFALIFVIFAYGAILIYLGMTGNKIIKKIGRVREVTYIFAMFVPIFYGAIPFSFAHLFAALLFFPLFYFAIELIDRYAPNPKAIMHDLAKK